MDSSESPDFVNKHDWNQLQTEKYNLHNEDLHNSMSYSVAMFDHQILQNR